MILHLLKLLYLPNKMMAPPLIFVSIMIIVPFFHFRRLAAETDEALKEQEERLGKILGKLQVSQAFDSEV